MPLCDHNCTSARAKEANACRTEPRLFFVEASLAMALSAVRQCARGANAAFAGAGRQRAWVSAVSAVRKGHGLDVDVLTAYLSKHLPGTSWRGVKVQQFRHGQSNPTYLLTTVAGQKVVLRKQPGGKILRGAHAVDREHEVMAALHGVVPVPNPLIMCEDTSVVGTPFFMYNFVEGNHYGDALGEGLDAAGRRTVYKSMVDTLAS